ncbi:MAG: class I SAM-dependent methyltransferase [Acidimicrobiales bacterium]
MGDSPYPELKSSHTMARTGRPWRDRKPAPSGPVWGLIQGYANYWILVAALELRVFDAMADGAVPFDDLVTALDADPPSLRSLLDALAVLGMVEARGEDYGLTEVAERYLVRSSPASMAELVAVAPGPLSNWTTLADTVRTGRPAAPVDDDPAGFYGPLVDATFATQHRVATRLDLWVRYSRRRSPRVLDLGAGSAAWSIAILEACPGATATVNDLPSVIGRAEDHLARRGVADRATMLPGDFHEVELESGAFDIVVLGHVLRTEGDELARALVHRAAEATAPGGLVMVADYFSDGGRAMHPFGVLMGATMMASTERGGPIRHAAVAGWMAEAGLGGVRLVEPIAAQQVIVARRPNEGEGP